LNTPKKGGAEMLKQEAIWWHANLFSIMKLDDCFPMLNVGSSTKRFRTITQPHIDKQIFEPLRNNNLNVQHLDIKNEPGVDIVGDINDPQLLARLSNYEFKSILCSHLLEHIVNQNEFCKRITSIIPVGGYIFVSCPFKYPYHPDPFDNGFRPNVESLASMFPGTIIINSAVIKGGTFLNTIFRNPKSCVIMIARILFPFYKFNNWINTLRHLPWLFKEYQASCVILKKVS
jgi:hypothetical protein